MYTENLDALRPYAFYLVGIFLRLGPDCNFVKLFNDWDKQELQTIWKQEPQEQERRLEQNKEWQWGQEREEWRQEREEQGQKQKWQHMVRNAWHSAPLTIGNTHCVELLSDLVEETKKFMGDMLVAELEQLIEAVDYLIGNPERRGLLEQRERVAISVKDLRDLAKNKLENAQKI
ncbi:hypothetical protein F4604DRAFT_1707829, partial [Suillus subluteus]